MKNKVQNNLTVVAALAFAFAWLLAPLTVQARNISKSARAGAYSVTLKVLPAESFGGPKAEMARDGGAAPNMLHGPEHPNHHLVVFVRKDGKPVEKAEVSIKYRKPSSKGGAWKSLPVVRMHVAGKGLQTTHYGNNLKLGPGNYEARVTVNGSKPAIFHFSLK